MMMINLINFCTVAVQWVAVQSRLDYDASKFSRTYTPNSMIGLDHWLELANLVDHAPFGAEQMSVWIHPLL